MRVSPFALLGLSLVACTVDSNPGTPSTPGGGSANQNTSGTAGVGSSSNQVAGTSNAGTAQGGSQPIMTGGNAGAFVSAGANAGGAGAGTGGGAGGATGGSNSTGMDTPPARPLMVDAAGSCKCEIKFSAKSIDPTGDTSTSPTHAGDQQAMKFDTSKPPKKKLAIVLGGINGGPGPGGIYGYAIGKGYHAFLVATQTNESSAPDEFKGKDDAESNRQVGDARMEAWDGKDRVAWLDVKRPDSIERRTELALKHAQEMDPGADWAYYLNADGSVRWSDVVMVGYSFGAQTIAMVAKYVRFSRAIITSGPTDEDFPKATWLTAPSATPLERMFVMVGAQADYPPASGDVGDKIDTVKAAGWLGEPLNVHSGDAPTKYTPPYKGANILVLVGQGHSEMCAGDGGNWKGICDYAFDAL
jgi:hypothetical protein